MTIPANLLRLALVADAVASGATGLLMFAGAGLLAGLLGLPDELLRYAGDVLLPTMLGYAFVLVQAVAVGVLAELQWIGLRREARTA